MQVKVGFIGAGNMAKGHMRRLAMMADVKLAAFADINQKAAEEAAATYGGRAYTDHCAMLADTELDAVFIVLPPFAHGPAEEAVLEKKLPLFVEKPVDLDLGRAREFAAEIERLELVSAAGYQERYMEVIRKLKSFLAGRQVGLFMGYWLGGTPQVGWWRRKAMSGGQAVEQTTHVFDMVRFLFGEVQAVQAVGRPGLNPFNMEGFDVEIASAANLLMADGTIGTVFSACFVTIPASRPAGIDIFCTDATINYKRRHSVLVHTAGQSEEWLNHNQYDLEAVRTFIDAVAQKRPDLVASTYGDAVRSLEVSLAVNRAMETKETVSLPLQ
ncbi:MAG TPA: Gfo/Idh/MocA family oxidoreductase [Firmicutes bacterium]|nr:Gfo/Idh/MocA family oxidoreductase [Bacillota bacterium]